jgi:hypothetical protein
MTDEQPLTEQEKCYLNALKLFMERGGKLELQESAKMLDELSPDQARDDRPLPPSARRSTSICYVSKNHWVDFANTSSMGAH